MKVAIHELERGLLSEWSRRYIAILEHNRIDWKLLSIDDLQFWREVQQCTHFIYHWGGSTDAHQKAHSILPIIEFQLRIPVFPDWRLSWHYDDKIKGFYLLNAHGYPVIESAIFYNKAKAITWLNNEANFPIVFKLKRGAGSKDVVLVQTKRHAMRITKKIFGSGIISGRVPGNDIWIKQIDVKKFMENKARALYRYIRGYDANRSYYVHKNYVVFQKFLPGNTFDTRITTIGDRIFAFRRYNRKNDFRASGSGKIDYNIEYINKECLRIAYEISKDIGFSCMTYDFLFDKEEPKIAEISYTFNDLAIYNCLGYWDAGLNFHDGHYMPEHLQLIDFLGIPDMKAPKVY